MSWVSGGEEDVGQLLGRQGELGIRARGEVAKFQCTDLRVRT